MFEDIDLGEINPTAIGVGLVCGLIVAVVMNQSPMTGLLWKIVGFGIGAIGGYFIGLKNFS